MCGIAGIHSLTDGLDAPSLAALKAMAGALRHRGPDETGVYRDVLGRYVELRHDLLLGTICSISCRSESLERLQKFDT